MAKVVQLRNIKRALRLEPCETVNYIVGGRVSNFRTYKSFNFIELVDGSTQDHLQLVVKKDLLKKPELGAYLRCEGSLVPSPGPKQAVEFKVNHLHYASKCEPTKYPLAETNKVLLTDGWYRKDLHLRPRADHFASLLRVRSELELSLHMIFKQMDFFRVHTPVLTSNDSEASSDLFMATRSRQSSKRPNGADNIKSSEDISDKDKFCENLSSNSQVIFQDDNNGSKAAETGDFSKCGSDTGEEAGLKKNTSSGDYFNKDVFMITSAQLHLESLAASLSRVYCLAPAFRAESSLSRRHLCEFLMLEAEEANVTKLEPLMDRVESIIKFSAQFLSEISEFKSDFSTLLDKYSNHTVYDNIASSKYVRMTYDEAIKILENLQSSTSLSTSSRAGGSYESTSLGTGYSSSSRGGALEASSNISHYGCDINRQHEMALLNYCNNVPIFITNYPKHLKPFYMKCTDNTTRGAEALCFDLIAPFGGEICGGSLREDNLETLRDNLKSNRQELEQQRRQRRKPGEDDKGSGRMGLLEEDRFQWYLDLREFGSFPHGGFGVGFERLIQSLLGVKNIRDTLAYPRWRGNCQM